MELSPALAKDGNGARSGSFGWRRSSTELGVEVSCWGWRSTIVGTEGSGPTLVLGDVVLIGIASCSGSLMGSELCIVLLAVSGLVLTSSSGSSSIVKVDGELLVDPPTIAVLNVVIAMV